MSEEAVLSAALRMIRRRRGLRAADVARAMNMPLRTYQHFEAGQSPFDLGRIRKFAEVTDSDPHGIVAAVMLRIPDLAVRTMDNKLVSVVMTSTRRFDERVGDGISKLEVGRLIATFRRAFGDLETELSDREAQVRDWFGGGSGRASDD